MNVRAAIADRRIRAALGGALVVVVVLVVIAAASGGRSSGPPPDEAAKLVPANALVYVHLSTDTGRDATKAALKLAQRFPSFGRLRNTLLARLQDPRCGTDLRKQHGEEAALALLSSRTGTAGSLVLVDTGKEHKAAATKLRRFCRICSRRPKSPTPTTVRATAAIAPSSLNVWDAFIATSRTIRPL